VAKPFDATLNSLIDARPEDWVAFLCARVGIPSGPAEILDTDLSVTAQADKVFRLPGPPEVRIHLELEANSRLGIPADLLRYSVLLGHGHDHPVHTVLLLLRPKANATDMTGTYTRAGAGGRPYLEFRYTVVRLWEEPIRPLQEGGPGTPPLALLTDEAAADLDAAFARFAERLRRPDVDGRLVKELLGSTYVLSGLRHAPERMAEYYRRLSMTLEDSTTYQWILQKGVAQGLTQGAEQEARRLLLLQGRKRFGAASASAEAVLQGIADAARLERMAERIFDATGWDDLLATP
jgi:predicted transposase YdaD